MEKNKRYLVERCRLSGCVILPDDTFYTDDPEEALERYFEYCRKDPAMSCIESDFDDDADGLLGYAYLNWQTKYRSLVSEHFCAGWFRDRIRARLNGTEACHLRSNGCYQIVEPFSLG